MNERTYRAREYIHRTRRMRRQHRAALAQWAALAAFIVSLGTCLYVFLG